MENSIYKEEESMISYNKSNHNFATTNTPASSGVDTGDSKAHDRREGDGQHAHGDQVHLL
jgi:hypothetical protein